MTKLASMAINRKHKIFFSRTRRPMILKLGVKHQAMKLYKVYINHDHGMTLTFLRQGQLRSPMHLHGKNRKISFNGRKHARNELMDRKLMFMKIFWAKGVVCPCPRAIYMYMAIIFKHPLLWNRLANQSQTLCGSSLERGNGSLYKWSRSHDQDGRHGYK